MTREQIPAPLSFGDARRTIVSLAAALITLITVLALPTDTAHAVPPTFTVNQTGNQADADTGDLNCDVDLGTLGDQCTLRAAIEQANANPGVDTIAFNIPAATDPGCNLATGVCMIMPLASLPSIGDPVTITGETQAGFAGTPLIDLNGILTGAGVDGLKVTAGGTTIRGLLIRRFPGDGIELAAGGNNTIQGNFIGTDETGMITDPPPTGGGDESGNLGNGVFINSSANNTIGGTDLDPQHPARNVIAGNGRTTNSNGDGVEISGAGATGNQVVGNHIGISVDGAVDLGNRGFGVLISGVPNNTIGGTTAAERNVISGNSGGGVKITAVGASSNVVRGNYIGTNAAGLARTGNSGAGVLIDNGATNNTIGGTTAGAVNVISGNTSGVQINSSTTTGNKIEGNFIGTDAAGTASLRNTTAGVQITGASANTVGGTSAAARNVISGNWGQGVSISGVTATGNQVQGNFIGTDVTGMASLGNGISTSGTGVLISNASTNTIGGTAAGAGNVISANVKLGVEISGASASGNLVQGNFIGTDVNGTADLGNAEAAGGAGVYINGSDNNTIGGTSAAARNIISGNGGGFLSPGVWVNGSGATGNFIRGNYIGVDVSGGVALGNGGDGVVISDSPGNTIGGTSPGERNVISANGLRGIEISGGTATGNQVQGNYVGTDAAGLVSTGNANSGVFVSDAPNNTIGGTIAGARNVISGNGDMGIEIINPGATGNLVQGNYIGTDAGGTMDRGNAQYGVFINFGAPANTVGGTTTAARNLISGNGTGGMFINDSNGNFVRGNYIGTEVTGTSALGNTFDGVRIGGTGNGNQVGGTVNGAGNTIAFNSGDGVRIDTGTGNAVLGNSIHSNNELGIDLANDGADTNDAGDPDTGANNKQNYPVVTSAESGSIRVQGTLNSTASTAFRLEFFSSPACDATGKGEGKTYLGYASVTTDGSGNASFNSVFYVSVTVGHVVTSTATDPANNTSEFSGPCQPIVAGPPIPTPTPSPTPVPGTTDPAYYRPVTPARVLDTRIGVGSPATPIPGGTSRAVQVTGQGGVPASGVTSVVMNVTVTQPTTGGYLTVYPSDASLPLASNLNFKAGQTVPNLVTVRVGAADGKVKVYNSAGATHVIFDVAGWYGSDPAGGNFYNPVDPSRILDTRDGTGGILGVVGHGAGGTKTFQVTGNGVPASATAVVLNATVTGSTANSYLTLYPANEALPLASNLNFTTGQTVPNLVIVKLSPAGTIKIYNNAGYVHVILDVAGWFEPGAGTHFRGLTPGRILDTRTGTGGYLGKVPPGSEVSLKITGAGGVPLTGVSAVALNVTVTQPTAIGFLTLYPSGTPMPVVSNLNFKAGHTVPNAVIVKVGTDGYIRIFNSSGSTHVVVDVAGWFEP